MRVYAFATGIYHIILVERWESKHRLDSDVEQRLALSTCYVPAEYMNIGSCTENSRPSFVVANGAHSQCIISHYGTMAIRIDLTTTVRV